MRKLICYIENGGSIAFEGVEAKTVYDFLSGYTKIGELDDPDTSIIIGQSMTVERSKEGVNIKL